MKCSNCDKELIIIEHELLELDWCPDCRGFWFDANEWQALGVKKSEDDPFLAPKSNSQEKLKNCPICGITMEKVEVNGVLLDRCPDKHGVWFDNGELKDFIKNSTSYENKTVSTVSYLKEIFTYN